MSNSNNPILWEDETFIIETPQNPHIAYAEGPHLKVATKHEMAHAWEDPDTAAEAFKLASKACRIMEKLELAPWFNIQANGNWGLLPGAKPFFHIHVYGRKMTETWGKPVTLPEAPKTYQHDPMPISDREKLIKAFKSELG